MPTFKALYGLKQVPRAWYDKVFFFVLILFCFICDMNKLRFMMSERRQHLTNSNLVN